MFQSQANTKNYKISQGLLGYTLKDNDPLSPHVIKMVCYVQSLDSMDFPIREEASMHIILNSLIHIDVLSRTTTCMVWIGNSLNYMEHSRRPKMISRNAPIKC
jgi:hypothetical protein